ncbi:hypothetical protein ACYATO_07570 [Lactobacillaceae bacterium Melli_B3]
MFNQFGIDLIQQQSVRTALDISMGIEVERMRSDQTGHMMTTDHPKAVGDPMLNPWITKDYLESMTEIVTPAV